MRRNEHKPSAESLHTARKTLSASFVAAAFCLVAGAGSLLVDLGRPDRALSLLTRPSPSYVAVGAWALGACLCLALLSASVWERRTAPTPALGLALHGITAAVSAVVMAYTGLLLASIMAMPLWDSPWLAPLFFLSAASCGCAVVLLCARGQRLYRTYPRVMRTLLLADGIIIALEAAATAAFIACAAGPAGPGALTAQTAAALPLADLSPYEQTRLIGAFELVRGLQSPWFWSGYVLCGLAAPLALGATARANPRLEPALAPACAIGVLIGGAVLRYCIVLAGTQTVCLL
jgi:polysulfide reductase chain C